MHGNVSLCISYDSIKYDNARCAQHEYLPLQELGAAYVAYDAAVNAAVVRFGIAVRGLEDRLTQGLTTAVAVFDGTLQDISATMPATPASSSEED